MGIGYLFYDSWIGGVCLLPCIILLYRWYRNWKERREKARMLEEFKELLYSLSGNLKAGYSVENAWAAAVGELHILYPQNGPLLEEAEAVIKKLHLHIPVETAVDEFSEQSGLEEIRSFAEVLHTAKRSGGNLAHMMDKTTEVIAEKIEVEQEIQTLLSGKKLEQRIMCGMPVLMLLYLRLTNGTYLEAVYHNWTGIIIMTVCLLGTGLAAYWGGRVVRIEV